MVPTADVVSQIARQESVLAPLDFLSEHFTIVGERWSIVDGRLLKRCFASDGPAHECENQHRECQSAFEMSDQEFLRRNVRAGIKSVIALAGIQALASFDSKRYHGRHFQ
jgi:hypothetical protein